MSSMNEVAQTSDQVEIRVRLLGAVEVTDRHGEVLDLGPDKCRAVLAALALSAGAVVPVSRIVALVWGAEPPRTADKTLQSYVTRLRKVLGPDSIQRSGAAYRLQLLPGAVDAARFQQRLDDGDLAGALTEWRGLPLAGLDTGGFGATIDGLVEQWLGAVEEELAAQVDRDASAAIGPLTELVADHPFREGLWALLMTALYRVGRQADALAAYRRARRHLVEELGVEPGPRLRALEASILDHDDRLGAGRRPAEDGAVPTGTVTFGFVDVVGAAGLWSERRREIGRALGRIDDVVRAAVEEVGGHVFSAGGESYGVAFHRPTEAASWADAVQGGVRAIDETDRLGLSVRIGLHTGETEERARGYFGPAVNLAASLAAIGNDGQTLVSGATAAMLGSSGLRPLGRYRLDGVVNDQRVHQLGGGEHPPLRTERSRRGNLPRSVGRLLGRDDAVAAVSAALRTAPAVTLVGPGGIGKTRLALAAAGAAADDVDDGVWLVELAGIASSEDVARAAADVLGVAERAGRPLIESIVTALGPRRLLLVLDNCEHVIDGAAELTDAIGRSCPAVRVLATSREGLGCDGEQLVVVPPLDPAGPGVDLFIERAAAVGGSFDPGADRARIEEVCRRLDGVPLAIELAAARTRTLSPADLVDRLDDRLRLLTGGRRVRSRSLRCSSWSRRQTSLASSVRGSRYRPSPWPGATTR
ncbi:MAG: BTAD domain-containing putative transcriptional regulator, partial [Actinomycetota bacterium]